MVISCSRSMEADILVKVKRVISSPHDGYRYFRKMGKKAISSPHDGYRYFIKSKERHIFSTEWIPIF